MTFSRNLGPTKSSSRHTKDEEHQLDDVILLDAFLNGDVKEDQLHDWNFNLSPTDPKDPQFGSGLESPVENRLRAESSFKRDLSPTSFSRHQKPSKAIKGFKIIDPTMVDEMVDETAKDGEITMMEMWKGINNPPSIYPGGRNDNSTKYLPDTPCKFGPVTFPDVLSHAPVPLTPCPHLSPILDVVDKVLNSNVDNVDMKHYYCLIIDHSLLRHELKKLKKANLTRIAMESHLENALDVGFAKRFTSFDSEAEVPRKFTVRAVGDIPKKIEFAYDFTFVTSFCLDNHMRTDNNMFRKCRGFDCAHMEKGCCHNEAVTKDVVETVDDHPLERSLRSAAKITKESKGVWGATESFKNLVSEVRATYARAGRSWEIATVDTTNPIDTPPSLLLPRCPCPSRSPPTIGTRLSTSSSNSSRPKPSMSGCSPRVPRRMIPRVRSRTTSSFRGMSPGPTLSPGRTSATSTRLLRSLLKRS